MVAGGMGLEHLPPSPEKGSMVVLVVYQKGLGEQQHIKSWLIVRRLRVRTRSRIAGSRPHLDTSQFSARRFTEPSFTTAT
jgi:hypothetical protein